MVNWKKLKNSIPSRVQVNKSTWFEVLWVDEFTDDNVLAEMRPDTKQIVIRKNQSPKETVKKYIHELTHMYADFNKIGLTETQVIEIEEKIVYYLLKPGNIFTEQGKK